MTRMERETNIICTPRSEQKKSTVYFTMQKAAVNIFLLDFTQAAAARV
jgi:hypothetical protein